MADRISAHRYYDGSDSCQASPRPAGLLAYLAHTSQRSASNHKGDPDIALHAISAYPMCFRLRLLPASSPSLPAESSSSSCGPPVRLRLLSTPPRSDAVTFGYRALAYPDTDSHRAVCAPSRAHWERRPRRDAASKQAQWPFSNPSPRGRGSHTRLQGCAACWRRGPLS